MTLPLLLIVVGLGLFAATALLWQGWKGRHRRRRWQATISSQDARALYAQAVREGRMPWAVDDSDAPTGIG